MPSIPNSEMSSQNIPLKARTDSPIQNTGRQFAFELRRWGYAARASCQDLSRRSCAGVEVALDRAAGGVEGNTELV
jgi:hypothetical protein